MANMFKYIAAFCLMGCISANPTTTACPDVKGMQNFEATKFMGKWYHLARYPYIFQTNTKCNVDTYSLTDDGKIKVFQRDFNTLTGVTETIVGLAHNVSATEAKFIVHFPSRLVQIDAPYIVLGTDYENYSVVWVCEEKGDMEGTYAWILTRDLNPTKSIMDKIEKVIKDSGINRSTFEKVSQDGCTYE